MFKLDSNTKLFVELYAKPTDTYLLTMDDAQYASCSICVYISSDSSMATGLEEQSFWALGEGSLMLKVADSTRVAGSMQKIRLRQVTSSLHDFTEVNNGCTVTIDDVEFDMAYSMPFAP